MPAPGSLYGEGAQLLDSAGTQASNIAKERQAATDTTVKAGESAGANLSAERTQISSQQAQMALKKMELSENHVEITPQLALGLARTTGDKSWIEAIGQTMRADVYTGLYTHGIEQAYAKRSPKITQVYDENGKIRHAVVYTDEQGNPQQLMLDAGITPDKLHPHKPSGSGDDFKKNKEFMKSHEKAAAFFNDAVRSKQLKSQDPEQWNRMHEEYIKDQDRYDQLKTSMGGSGASQPGGRGDTPAPDNAPFDADAFIKDALGQ